MKELKNKTLKIDEWKNYSKDQLKEVDIKNMSSKHFFPIRLNTMKQRENNHNNLLSNTNYRLSEPMKNKKEPLPAIIDEDISSFKDAFIEGKESLKEFKDYKDLRGPDFKDPFDDYQSLIRPVCRKKEPIEQADLEKGNQRVLVNKRPISTSNLIRPPSRHKTLNKALGLDIPNDPLDIIHSNRRRPNTSKKESQMDHSNTVKGFSAKFNDMQQIDSPGEIKYVVCKTEEEDLVIAKEEASPILPKELQSKKFSNTKYENFFNKEISTPIMENKSAFKMQKTNYDVKFFNSKDQIKDKIEDINSRQHGIKKFGKLQEPKVNFKSSLGSEFLNLFANKDKN